MRLFASIIICLMLCQPLLAAEVRKLTSGPNGNRDCSTCHPQAANVLASSGTKHINKSGCVYCHKGHPPEDSNVIPMCSQCHTGNSSHYNQSNCKKCHISAHAPQQVKLLNDCLDCHAEVNAKIKQNASKHTRLACTACHLYSIDKPHGFIPDCLSCHKPHEAGQTTANCKKCHHAHMPKNYAYDFNTPSKLCGACHKKAYGLLSASKFKHQKLVCAACHQSRHKIVPQCQACHRLPHTAKLHAQFPKCATCHNSAHDLSDPTVKTNLLPL